MIITALEKVRGHQFRITLSDGRQISVDQDALLASPFRPQDEIDEEALAALLDDSGRRRAKDYALYLLSVRDYSAADLHRKLREKGYADHAEETVKRLIDAGLQSDGVYARRLARDCRVRRCFSRRRTAQELFLHGIGRDLAAEAIDEIDEAEDLFDADLAAALLAKKRYTPYSDERERQRGWALLARYGYDSAAIREAWRILENDTD